MADKQQGAIKKAPPKLTIRHTLTSKLRMVKANPFLDLKTVEDMEPGPSRRTTFQAGGLPLQRKLIQQETKKALTELRQVEKKAPVEVKRALPVKRLFPILKDKSGPNTKTASALRKSQSQPVLRKPATAPAENQPKQSARARALSYCPRPPVVKKATLPKPATTALKPEFAIMKPMSAAMKPAIADKEKPAPLKSVASRTATPARPSRYTRSAKENQPATPGAGGKAAEQKQPPTPAKLIREYRPPTPGARVLSKTPSRSLSASERPNSTVSGEELCTQQGQPRTPKGPVPKSLLRSASAHNVRKSIAPSKGAGNRDVQKENRPVTPVLKSLLRSQSARDIRKSNTGNDDCCAEETKLYGTIATPRKSKTVTFFSPFGRSSISAHSELNNLKTPPPSVLRERLNKWLVKRGKLSYNFSHLRCFGLHSHGITPKEPEVIAKASPNLNETITIESSPEEMFAREGNNDVTIPVEELEQIPLLPLAASSPEEANKENVINEEFAGPEVLVELRTLIFSGYPRDQCEQWLRALTKVRPSLDDLPEYWECLAALEEARGDFNSAVDCYGRAIVKGADEDKVGDSLDRLWEKFSQLSSSPNLRNRTPSRRALIDPKQIFKSSVIKFALQNKAVKKFSADTGVKIPSLVCTPVRRSTRRSASGFRSTPTVKCVSSLNELEKDERENMEFHSNIVLNPNVK